jgi:hypothetical protein
MIFHFLTSPKIIVAKEREAKACNAAARLLAGHRSTPHCRSGSPDDKQVAFSAPIS